MADDQYIGFGHEDVSYSSSGRNSDASDDLGHFSKQLYKGSKHETKKEKKRGGFFKPMIVSAFATVAILGGGLVYMSGTKENFNPTQPFYKIASMFESSPVKPVKGSRKLKVENYAKQMNAYWSDSKDPESMKSFMRNLEQLEGTQIAYNALLYAKAPEKNLVPTDDVNFRKLAAEIAKTKKLPSGSLTPEIVRQLYSEEIRSLSFDSGYLGLAFSAAGVISDAIRSETGNTKRNELIRANIAAQTSYGMWAQGYSRHHGELPPPGMEVYFMNNVIPERPSARPNTLGYHVGTEQSNVNGNPVTTRTYTTQRPVTPFERFNNPSNLQSGPRGSEGMQRAEQDAKKAIESGHRIINDAIGNILNPPKKQQQ